MEFTEMEKRMLYQTECYSLVYLNQNPFFFFKLNKIQDASI